jgi:tetratricopeptide (TPR) repeat protein
VAAYVLLGDMTLEMGHIEMANYFEASGDLTSAFNEYRALIYTVPYLDLFYEPAVRISVKMKAYPQAMQVLQELLHYQKTPFVYQWMGQVYLGMHEISNGIDFLEKARQINPRNPVLLFNLGLAYYTAGQDEKGDEILDALKSISSDHSLIDDLKNYRKGIHKK